MTNVTINTTANDLPLAHGERRIVCTFKQPARRASIAIPDAPWSAVRRDVPEQYREAMLAILDKAAKDILSAHLKAFSIWPSTIDDSLFCTTALLDAATASGSEWMTKEEIEAAWAASTTRKIWVESASYTTNKEFRTQVAYYQTLITKLAGKTTSYTEAELDLMLAKWKEADMNSDLGQFMVRRIEAIRNKPAPSVMSGDLL